MRLGTGLLVGMLAGAAGTTALNAVSYLDMLASARPASSTPEATVEKLEAASPFTVPGDEEQRKNRIVALGPMTGIAVGVTVGGLVGIARSLGWRPTPIILAIVAAGGALIGSNGPMTILKVTDPRTWTAKEWASDIFPHLAFGAAAATVLWHTDAPRSRAPLPTHDPTSEDRPKVRLWRRPTGLGMAFARSSLPSTQPQARSS
jgi:hypothetical protein